MGFLNWLMKGVDVEQRQQTIDVAFEDEGSFVPTASEMQSDNRVGGVTVENRLDNLRNLSNMEKSSSVNVNLIDDVGATNYIPATSARQQSKIVVFKVSGMKDLQSGIKHLATKQPAILDMGSIKKKDLVKLMDYLNGAVFGLNATVHKMQGGMYVLSPEGTEVALQEKRKDKRRGM